MRNGKYETTKITHTHILVYCLRLILCVTWIYCYLRCDIVQTLCMRLHLPANNNMLGVVDVCAPRSKANSPSAQIWLHGYLAGFLLIGAGFSLLTRFFFGLNRKAHCTSAHKMHITTLHLQCSQIMLIICLVACGECVCRGKLRGCQLLFSAAFAKAFIAYYYKVCTIY